MNAMQVLEPEVYPDHRARPAGRVVASFFPWRGGKGGAPANPSRWCRSDESDAWPRGRTLLLRGRSPTFSSPGAELPAPAPGFPSAL
jgi:hypothetical protein